MSNFNKSRTSKIMSMVFISDSDADEADVHSDVFEKNLEIPAPPHEYEEKNENNQTEPLLSYTELQPVSLGSSREIESVICSKEVQNDYVSTNMSFVCYDTHPVNTEPMDHQEIEILDVLGTANSDCGRQEVTAPLTQGGPQLNTKTKRQTQKETAKGKHTAQEKHPMLTPCAEKCICKCSSKLTEEQRKELWQEFWNQDIQGRRNFISRNVERNKIAVKYSKTSKRNHTLFYKLLDSRVCKKMFLSTFGYSNDSCVQAVLQANFKLGRTAASCSISAAPDLRGKQKPAIAFDDDYFAEVDSFIESFHPVASHYRLKHAPNRRYLPTGITFTVIYKQLKSHLMLKGLKQCSWATFHSRIKKKNISTQKPENDKCPQCETHHVAHPIPKSNANTPDQTTSYQNVEVTNSSFSDADLQLLHNCSQCTCKACENYPQHILNKNTARKHLNDDCSASEASNNTIGLFTVNMQKCITVPKLDNKDFYFSRKLSLYNETFAAVGKGNKNSVCILWNECESARKASDIATTYVVFLQKCCRDFQSVILYADNCSAQNKNKILFSALLRLIHDKNTELKTIKIEYLETGHTFMSADSIHGSIAKRINSAGNLFDVNEFISTIQKSRKNLSTYELKHNDFFKFKNELKATFPRGFNSSKFKIVEFRRGYPFLFVKTDYLQSEFIKLDVLNKGFKTMLEKIRDGNSDTSLFESISRKIEANGISQIKKDDLLKLLKFMPLSRHDFYNSLSVNENVIDDAEENNED